VRSGGGGETPPRPPARAPSARALLARAGQGGGVRVAAALLALTIVAIGLVGGCAAEPSAEPTVRAFLLAWEQGRYWDAAGYTTGNRAEVAAALHMEYQQLGAAALYLGMGGVMVHRDHAQASFAASVDLGQDGAPWSYQGRFTLRRVGTDWKVDWSPGVINPALRDGLRLAVITQVPARALILDSAGHSLIPATATYVVGVRPDRLTDPHATATAFAGAVGLPADQVLSQILIAAPSRFQELLTLSPGRYAKLRRRLSRIKGLQVRQVYQRLFSSVVPEIVGKVDTENASLVRQEGLAYQPGATTGQSGLEAVFQHRLAGTPAIEVVVEDARGTVRAVLTQWHSQRPVPVRTTIDARLQSAAARAVSSAGAAAAIVAVQASTGRILAISRGASYGQPLGTGDVLNGHYPPGEAFTIVSTAALLSVGLSARAQIPCATAENVGGTTFTNDQPEPGIDAQPPFRTDFADACATAFAGLSRLLTPNLLTRTAATYGIGTRYRLPLPAFSGTVPPVGSDAGQAAQTIGEGGVQVSPLAMAMAAAEADSGSWHPPVLVTDLPDPGNATVTPLGRKLVGTLRGLMRRSVATGAAHLADVPGAAVFGQVGAAPLSGHGGRTVAYWFVGFRGDIAFAVLVLDKPGGTGAAGVAAAFLRAAGGH
jgi:cell division protein FtsI/penicillin-binding protein 2